MNTTPTSHISRAQAVTGVTMRENSVSGPAEMQGGSGGLPQLTGTSLSSSLLQRLSAIAPTCGRSTPKTPADHQNIALGAADPGLVVQRRPPRPRPLARILHERSPTPRHILCRKPWSLFGSPTDRAESFVMPRLRGDRGPCPPSCKALVFDERGVVAGVAGVELRPIRPRGDKPGCGAAALTLRLRSARCCRAPNAIASIGAQYQVGGGDAAARIAAGEHFAQLKVSTFERHPLLRAPACRRTAAVRGVPCFIRPLRESQSLFKSFPTGLVLDELPGGNHRHGRAGAIRGGGT
jgi:hypothetical protein